MIHGALYFRVGNRHTVRTLGRRAVRLCSNISSHLPDWIYILVAGSTSGQTPGYSSANLFPVIKRAHKSQSDTAAEKYIYPYLLDEVPAVPSPALLFKGLPGAGTDFLGIVKRLPCKTRDNAVVRQSKNTLSEMCFLITYL